MGPQAGILVGRSEVIDRMRFDGWVKQGGKDMRQRANERARQILDQYLVPPLPPAAEEEIAEVLARRRA